MYTGKTVVTREPEYDEYTVSRMLALAEFEGRRCPNCHNYDCIVPLARSKRNVTWAEHDSRAFVVESFRCLACGAGDLIKRDWSTAHEKDKPVPGVASAGDGLLFVTRPMNAHEKNEEASDGK